MTIAVIYGGTRKNGNTELLTEEAIKGKPAERIHLTDYKIEPIVDQRHAESGFAEVNDDYNQIIDRILPHEILLFSTPIYWYSMSGTMKLFVDRWSQILRDPNYPDFREKMSSKKAYVIAVGGDLPYLKGLPLIQQFQYIFDFMGISFEGYIIGEGNRPGEILNDKAAFFKASELNKTLRG
ncbi:multimeric flavodoxin WrbA [Bacillus oleivorans]|uniref:Multimeric flavodoxin WrbA n=1 Tax=Bacillus oleivorans TaxID=1448271 RepID=A0A285CT84_9BACI|nr:flavodoxin family protein [Bacillus oleivorans]SNX70732.1 multimeric flavodoxin WrbA [Bacillus oleivorans]